MRRISSSCSTFEVHSSRLLSTSRCAGRRDFFSGVARAHRRRVSDDVRRSSVGGRFPRRKRNGSQPIRRLPAATLPRRRLGGDAAGRGACLGGRVGRGGGCGSVCCRAATSGGLQERNATENREQKTWHTEPFHGPHGSTSFPLCKSSATNPGSRPLGQRRISKRRVQTADWAFGSIALRMTMADASRRARPPTTMLYQRFCRPTGSR